MKERNEHVSALVRIAMSPVPQTYGYVKKYIQLGADINYEATDGMTPLINAIINNNIGITELFIHNNADVNHESSDGYTPLLWAIIYERIEIVELLVAKGANVNQVTSLCISPLLQASLIGNVDIVRLLINNGADVNKKLFYHKANTVKSIIDIINDTEESLQTGPKYADNKDTILSILNHTKWNKIQITV